jgi:type IV pilus assembly protein PilO
MILDFWISINQRFKLWIIIALPLLLILSGYFLLLSPRFGEIEQLKNEQADLSAKLAQAKRTEQNLIRFRQEIAETERQFKASLVLLPEKKDMPRLLSAISLTGSEEGIEFLDFKPEKEIQKDFYLEIPVMLKAKGTFQDLGAFLVRLKSLDRLISIRQMELLSYEPATRRMILQCMGITYQFLEKKADAPPPPPKAPKKK